MASGSFAAWEQVKIVISAPPFTLKGINVKKGEKAPPKDFIVRWRGFFIVGRRERHPFPVLPGYFG